MGGGGEYKYSCSARLISFETNPKTTDFKINRSSTHAHKSSKDDERLILVDLRALRPFAQVDGRSFESFHDISYDPTHLFNNAKFKEWIARHKNNILIGFPVSDNTEQSIDNAE